MCFKRKRKVPDVDSHKALYLAEKHLQDVQARQPEVQRIVNQTVSLRQANHFAEQLTALLKGGKTA